MSIMMEKTADYQNLIADGPADYSGLETKSSEFAIPEDYSWAEKYLTMYCQPDDIYDWDEYEILQMAILDERLTDMQRIELADALSFAFTVKSYALDFSPGTKARSESDCYRAYNRKCARALGLYIIAGGISALLLQLEGIIIAACGAYSAIDQAQDDLDDCLSDLQ